MFYTLQVVMNFLWSCLTTILKKFVIWFNAGTTMILYEAAILLLIQCGPVLKSVVFF